MLKKYESMIIIVSTLTEEDSKQELEKINSFIKKNGGEVLNTDDWGKKRLAYKINDFNEGYYFVNYFNFDTNKVSKLERMYKLNENVIRYNIQTK